MFFNLFSGSAFAVSIANLTMLSLIVAYICCSKKFETTWPGEYLNVLFYISVNFITIASRYITSAP